MIKNRWFTFGAAKHECGFAILQEYGIRLEVGLVHACLIEQVVQIKTFGN